MSNRILSLAWVATLIIACVGDDTASKCSPGQQFTCTCPSGQQSTQSCAQDGNGFTPCQCGSTTVPDSGDTSDTGRSTDSSNSITDVTVDTAVDACVPLTKSQVCTNPSDAGLPFCGNHSDNCGGNINCGSSSQCGTQCIAGESCLTTQVCGHDGTCNWQGYELCDTQTDLCGGTINCGSCNYGTCYLGQVCACGRSPNYDLDCTGGTPHAYACQFGGSPSSSCSLADSINHVFCCP
jgi:hypothetical protein